MTMTTTNGAMAHAPEGRAVDASILERVLVAGDLSRLQPQERVAYYDAVCRSVALNPLTEPFKYINLNGKLTLYSTKNATDQLRQINGVSVESVKRETHEGIHVVSVVVKDNHGRRDEDIGAVSIKGLVGEALANALMKATTKAKRRATLSVCGLSFPDESEVESIPGARVVTVTSDGEVIDPPKLPAAPPQLVTLDEAVFQRLCEDVDAAENAPALNKVATASAKAQKSGAITPAQLDKIKVAVTKKRALFGTPTPPPSAPDQDPHNGIEAEEMIDIAGRQPGED